MGEALLFELVLQGVFVLEFVFVCICLDTVCERQGKWFLVFYFNICKVF